MAQERRAPRDLQHQARRAPRPRPARRSPAGGAAGPRRPAGGGRRVRSQRLRRPAGRAGNGAGHGLLFRAGAPAGGGLVRQWAPRRPRVAARRAAPGGRSMGEEPRVLLAARAAGLRVFVAHFDLPAPVRQAQADALLAAVGDPHGTVVLGDLNEGPDGPAVRKLLAAGFRDAWAECSAQELVTAPWDRPQTRIDQVLLGPGLPRARSARALSTDASDHALVLVEL